MPFAEILIGSLAPAVAKSLLTMWLKDQTLVVEVGAELITLFKQKGLDLAAQRAGRRTFEKIGDEVAKHIAPIFGDAGLSEAGQEAVALEVAATLEHVRISAELLREKNLDPLVLARFFRDARPEAMRAFSTNEEALYWRILQEVARRIIEIMAQLPGFYRETLGEVLKREDELQKIALETLSRLQALEAATRAANPILKFAEFETRYREMIVRTLDRVQLIGIDVAPTSREQRLSTAYISLCVADRSFKPYPLMDADLDDAAFDASYRRADQFAAAQAGAVGKQRLPGAAWKGARNVEDVLPGQQRLLIRGLAGSGKTTLLKWIAVSAAGRRFDSGLERWNDAVPFFLPLREYVDKPLPAPDDFPRSIAPMLADEVPQGWARSCLRSGRALVLVDSVDEMPQSQRLKVKEWLNHLVGEFDQALFVVTSRPSAIEEGWLERAHFTDAELLPMSLPDMLLLIDHWHAAVQEEARNDQEKAELERLKIELQQQIKAARPLQRLATSPLLCAALCALHRERRGKLPWDRIELYEACCHMLLDRRGRDQDLAVETKHGPDLAYGEKRTLLAELAYWMMLNTHTELALDAAQDQITRTIQTIPRLAGSEPSAVLLRLVERSGIIREPRVGYVDYIHRTFQEFLAAQAAAKMGNIGFLIDHADDDVWQETIQLTPRFATTKDGERLISGLIKRGDKSARRQHRAYLLAAACLQTSNTGSRELTDAVSQRLQQVVPPRSRDAAAAIAKAGELAIPYLKADQTDDEDSAVYAIEALAAIGGEIAFEALKSYIYHTRDAVVGALFAAAEHFDRQTYFRDLLSQLAVTSISLTDISSLEGFQYLTSIQSLTIIRAPKISDLSPLGELRNLTTLRLEHLAGVRDVSAVAGLRNLTTLVLAELAGVRDVSAVAGLRNLTKLVLVELAGVTDVSAVAGLDQLQELRLEYLAGVRDVSMVGELRNLTTLSLARLGGVTDVSAVGGLRNLTTLSLAELAGVTDVSAVGGLRNLTKLVLVDLDGVRDVSAVAVLDQLQELYLIRMNPTLTLPENLADRVFRFDELE